MPWQRTRAALCSDGVEGMDPRQRQRTRLYEATTSAAPIPLLLCCSTAHSGVVGVLSSVLNRESLTS